MLGVNLRLSEKENSHRSTLINTDQNENWSARVALEKAFDDGALVIYYARQHWKGGDSKYMSSNHSEVAAA
jgi:hypothetical protein